MAPDDDARADARWRLELLRNNEIDLQIELNDVAAEMLPLQHAVERILEQLATTRAEIARLEEAER